MDTRYLPSMPDYKGAPGARASRWMGWVNPKGRSVEITGRVNLSHPSEVDRVEERCGCYAVLYRAAPESYYTAYIGTSRYLRSEIKAYYRAGVDESADFPFTAVYIPGAEMSHAYELDLIRHYAPPWNVKFHR
jgi:hypothetical protein